MTKENVAFQVLARAYLPASPCYLCSVVLRPIFDQIRCRIYSQSYITESGMLERRSGDQFNFSLINFVHDLPRFKVKVASADDQMCGCNIVWSILLK